MPKKYHVQNFDEKKEKKRKNRLLPSGINYFENFLLISIFWPFSVFTSKVQ